MAGEKRPIDVAGDEVEKKKPKMDEFPHVNDPLAGGTSDYDGNTTYTASGLSPDVVFASGASNGDEITQMQDDNPFLTTSRDADQSDSQPVHQETAPPQAENEAEIPHDSSSDTDPDLDERIDRHAAKKADKMEGMSVQAAERRLLIVQETEKAFRWVLDEEQGEALLRKKLFKLKKHEIKLLSDEELKYALIEAEEAVKAIKYVLDEEEGEERLRKTIYKEKKMMAKGMSTDAVAEMHDKLLAELDAYAPIVERKRGEVEAGNAQ